MIEVIKSQPLDFIQVDYSLGESRGRRKRVAGRAGETRGGADQSAIRWPARRQPVLTRGRARDLPDWAAEIDAHSWGQIFLKYVVSHPAVTAAIPGMTKLAHLEDNLGALRGRMPDASMRARMEKYWDQRLRRLTQRENKNAREGSPARAFSLLLGDLLADGVGEGARHES